MEPIKPILKWRIAQRIEILWWKRYLKQKDSAEYLHWKRNYWEHFLRNADLDLSDLKEKRILDAACGPAGIFTILPNSRVTAIDPLITAYEQLSCFQLASNNKNHCFINCKLEDFESEQKFDVIFCLNGINHVSHLKRSIEQLVKQMTPDASLYVSIDCHKNACLASLFRFLSFDALHPQQFTAKQYIQFFEHFKLKLLNRTCVKQTTIFNYELFEFKKISAFS